MMGTRSASAVRTLLDAIRDGGRSARRPGQPFRRLRLEPLESRHLLSVTLGSIADQLVLSGAPLHVALSGTSDAGNPLTFTVEITDASLIHPTIADPQLSAVIPQGNPSLRMAVLSPGNGIDGEMVFELFEDLTPETVGRITGLVQTHFYDGLTFGYVVEGFLIQGGDHGGDPWFEFDDEYHPDLQFTGAGVLAMVNDGPDTNFSQFFITGGPTRWLDFRYSIFGFLTVGDDVRQQIEAVETDDDDVPLTDVVTTELTVFYDDRNGVLRLAAPEGTAGWAEVKVTVTDTVTGEWDSATFQVQVSPDDWDSPPFIGPMAPIVTTVDTPVTFQIPGIDVEGDPIYYDGFVDPANPNLTLVINEETGEATLTPSGGAVGVFSILVGISDSWEFYDFDVQMVPVYILPAAPSSVALLPASDTGASDSDGLTNLDNSPGNPLQFEVQGVLAGALVEVLAGDAVIGQAVAAGTSVIVTTDGSQPLADGPHQITARQTLVDQLVDVGNLVDWVDLESAPSGSVTIHVDATPPAFTSSPVTTARQGVAYAYQVTLDDPSDLDAFELVVFPSGMTIDPTTGLIAWVPQSEHGPTEAVTVRATDLAGNTALQTFAIDVAPPNYAPVLTPVAPSLGATDEDTTSSPISLGAFINAGVGTTTVTDEDEGALLGGIALVGATGNGTWEYSLDGTVFLAVGDVSIDSALLLPHDGWLRYTPDAENGETATVTYYAWDATAGEAGQRADATDRGGATAFSTEADTASLTVTDLNDAPLLVPVGPVLGATRTDAARTFAVAEFIHAGDGTTIVTDVDHDAVVGGIALLATTGNGTWEYSLDGAVFLPVGAVSEDSALLLPHDAWLRYTPDGAESETATIAYRAWDTTSGLAGDRADATVHGGTTAFSPDLDLASLHVNRAPELVAAHGWWSGINEDSLPASVFVYQFINAGEWTTTITDADENAVVGGIALVGAVGNGTWQYSLDGTTYYAVGAVSEGSALLLPHNARLRYTPDGENGETATITYRAWDTTGGAAGERADTTTSGGATPFSIATDTASLSVTDLNDAPVLVPATPLLGATLSDAAMVIALVEFINAGDGTTIVTDVDQGAVVGGIALLGATGGGTWEYSLDGTLFLSFGAVSEDSALLLPHDAWLRYTPAGSEAATIAYRAWDTTSGVAGERADTTVHGGTTAFSVAADVGALVANRAPELLAADPSLGATDENTTFTVALNAFINAGSGTTIVTDADEGALVGGIALVGAVGNGTWQYSLDGTVFVAVGDVSESSALLLPHDAWLRYVPDGQNGETAAITFRAWDTTSGAAGDQANATLHGGASAFSAATDTAALTVTDVNDAPVLLPAAPLANPTDENTPVTISLASFINAGEGTTTVTDVDNGAVVGGIALVATTGNGTWAYSLDGTTFLAVGALSGSSALLLPHDAFLRYTPDGENGEWATFTYRAWDATSGTAGSLADTTTNGGTTAFSSTVDIAWLEVTDVNDAPVLTPAAPSLGATGEDTPITVSLASFINVGAGTTTIADVDHEAVIGGIALAGTTGGGTWAYSLDGTNFTAVGAVSGSSALLLPASAVLRYTPAGAGAETATITYLAWDATSGTSGQRVDTSVKGGETAFSAAADTASLDVAATAVGSLSGFVYVDSNGDGLRIASNGQPELAIPGVVIYLLRVESGSLTLAATAVTGADGSYSFGNLPAGAYLVQQVQPDNYLDGRETLGFVAGASRGTAWNDMFLVELGPGEHGTQYNFGEQGLAPEAFSLRLLMASQSPGTPVPGSYNGASASADSSTSATPAPSPATSVSAVAGLLAITEMNYNPYAPEAWEVTWGFDDAQSFEFIELRNVGSVPIDLAGVRFVEGIQFDFTTGAILTLSPGEYVLVVQNWDAFELRYDWGYPVAGEYSGWLNNAGERIKLVDRYDAVIHDFYYREASPWPDGWPADAHGLGSSLEVIDLTGNYSDPANWRASEDFGGSPDYEALSALVFGEDEDWLAW